MDANFSPKPGHVPTKHMTHPAIPLFIRGWTAHRLQHGRPILTLTTTIQFSLPLDRKFQMRMWNSFLFHIQY